MKEKRQTHLAIINKKSQKEIFTGKKRYDFWFGRTKKAPYEDVRQGDEILFKEPGGRIKGKAVVENVLFLNTSKEIKDVDKYGQIAKNASWEAKNKKARFVTIIFFEKIEKYLAPVSYRKRDQRRWMVMK